MENRLALFVREYLFRRLYMELFPYKKEYTGNLRDRVRGGSPAEL